MPASVSSIALFAPIVASNAVFSFRRASKGADNIEEKPLYGAMNFDIAAGQVLKGSRAVKGIAVAADKDLGQALIGASDKIKKLSETNKVVNGAVKVIDFTADNINPIICATSAIKVLGSDDKLEAANREIISLGCMFAAEDIAKKTLGMPYTKKVNGKNVTFNREALYKKNPFVEKQVAAVKDFCLTRNGLKSLPAVAKGLAFVSASILGFKAGDAISNLLMGKPEPVKEPC